MKKISFAFAWVAFVLFTLSQFSCNSEDTSIKVGAVLSLSGNGSVAGDYTLKAIQLAIKQRNEKGGLLGQKLVLDIQDSKGKPSDAVDIAKRMLTSSNKPVLICSNTSSVCAQLKPLTESNQVMFLASAATEKLNGSKYVLRNYIESNQITKSVISFAQDTLKENEIGVFYPENEFGKNIDSVMKKNVIDNNLKISFSKGYSNENNSDYKSYLAANNALIKNSKLLYIVGLGSNLGIFIKQLRIAGFGGKIICDPLFNNPETITAVAEFGTGVYYLDFKFDQTQKSAAEFIESFKKEFNTSPLNLSVITFEAINYLFDTIEKKKTTNPDTIMAEIRNSKIPGNILGNAVVVDGNINYELIIKTFK